MAPQFVDEDNDVTPSSRFGSKAKESTNLQKKRAQVTTGCYFNGYLKSPFFLHVTLFSENWQGKTGPSKALARAYQQFFPPWGLAKAKTSP